MTVDDGSGTLPHHHDAARPEHGRPGPRRADPAAMSCTDITGPSALAKPVSRPDDESSSGREYPRKGR